MNLARPPNKPKLNEYKIDSRKHGRFVKSLNAVRRCLFEKISKNKDGNYFFN